MPDRVSDIVLLLALGWLVGSRADVYLGALAGCMAVLTAYVRAMACEVGATAAVLRADGQAAADGAFDGGAVGARAAPGGMACRVVGGRAGDGGLVESALWLSIVGCLVTACRRLMRIARYAKQGGTDDGDV